MSGESQTEMGVDPYANMSIDPELLVSLPSPSMGEGEGEGGDSAVSSANPLPLVQVDIPGEEQPVWVREDLVDQYLQEAADQRPGTSDPSAPLRTNGIKPFVVSLSNHGRFSFPHHFPRIINRGVGD